MTAVLTAIYGGYEVLKPVLPQTVPVEWICVTDDPALADDPRGWTVVVQPREGHPNRAAKWPKMAPGLYTDAETSVWVDGSFRITSAEFVQDMLQLLKRADQAQFEHPWRSCLYEEAAASLELPKYAGEPIAAQADWYRALCHPDDWGLWATGVIARRHTPQVLQAGWDWLDEIARWSFQDQVSQAFVLRLADLRPAPIPGMHLTSPWLAYQGSDRH